MLTLFHCPRTRSASILWLLEETGAPYELKRVTIQRTDGSGARDPANPHPHGKTPALMHDGALIYESTAIALYVADLFPGAGLAPPIGDARRGPFLSWLAYYSGVMEPAFVSKFLNYQVPRGAPGWVESDEAIAHLTGALNRAPYLLGDAFCAADIFYASMIALFMGNPLLPETPLLRAYSDRCRARPAFLRAQAIDAD